MDKENLRIVFFGTPQFAVESLDTLIRNGFNVVAAVTMPDKTGGRGHKVITSAVKDYAIEHNIPLLQPEKLKSPDFIETLKALEADLFIVIAFRMLPEAVWAMPPLGTFNLHASLLPRYRGAAPINRAVMNGDTETGVTTFFLKHEIDTGDVIARERIEIGPDEDAGSVHDRLMALGAKLTLETVQNIADGKANALPQAELANGEEPTPAPKIFKEDCRICWTVCADSVHNHIRGLAPHPGAWTELDICGNVTTVKILRSERIGDSCHKIAPGEIKIDNGSVIAGCGNGSCIALSIVQPAGKKAMSAADFARGLRLDGASRKGVFR